MLREFCIIRCALTDSNFQRSPRRITGNLAVQSDNVAYLTALLSNGNIHSIRKDGKNASHPPDLIGQTVVIILNPERIEYYEDIQDLVCFTAQEPDAYYVHSIGELRPDTAHPDIEPYRQMLNARRLLRDTADIENSAKAIFLTPEKIEIPLGYSDGDIPELSQLENLRGQFIENPNRDSADVDQRLVLFRKSIREYLKAHPPQERFGLFMRNFETIFDSYTRDYQLWVGNTFGELEKSFEEKRLKFVSDLNGILAGVQASLLAVPIAALLLADKFDPNNPLKDFLLACGVLTVGVIAFRLLQNQNATLDATREAIDAAKEDFERKHNKRREEFKTRLRSLDNQEKRIRQLLGFIKATIALIVACSFVGFVVVLAQS